MAQVGRPKKGVIDTKEEPHLTIEPKLFEAWQKIKRLGDAKQISKQFGYSQPVIGRALNFGYVIGDEIKNDISSFLMDRLRDERQTAVSLLSAIQTKNLYLDALKTMLNDAKLTLSADDFKTFGFDALQEIQSKLSKQ